MATMVELYEGGTTGLLNGTRVSSGTWSQPVGPPAALDTVLSLHYRVIDSVTGDDTGEDTTTTFTYTAPTGWTVSADNVTFGATATLPVAVGANKPVYFKQTARQSSANSSGQMATGGVTPIAGTRVGQVGAVTLTPTYAQISAAWDAVASADGYQVQYKLTADSTWTNASDVTSPSVITGLTGGSSYDVRVRAWSELGAGAWSATATATAGAFWADDFEDASLDAEIWTEYESGTVTPTESGGLLTVTWGELSTDYGGLKSLPVKTDIQSKFVVVQTVPAADSGTSNNAIYLDAQEPTAATHNAPTDWPPTFAFATNGPAGALTIRYFDNSGVAHYLQSAGTWTTTATSINNIVASSTVTWTWEFDAANSRWRLKVDYNDGSAKHVTSGYVGYSDTQDSLPHDMWFQVWKGQAAQKHEVILQSVAYSAL